MIQEALEDKKFFIFLAIVFLFIILTLGAVFFIEKTKKETIEPSLNLEESTRDQQLNELDRQRQETGAQTFTQDELGKQENELDNLHQATVGAEPTPDIQSQAEQLDKIKESLNN